MHSTQTEWLALESLIMHFQQHQEVLERLEQGGSALEGHCLIDSSTLRDG